MPRIVPITPVNYKHTSMPVGTIEHRGFIIKAAAFELVGERRYISSLIIFKNDEPDQKLFDLPVTHHLFSSAEEALESTLAHGRGIVDSLEPGR